VILFGARTSHETSLQFIHGTFYWPRNKKHKCSNNTMAKKRSATRGRGRHGNNSKKKGETVIQAPPASRKTVKRIKMRPVEDPLVGIKSSNVLIHDDADMFDANKAQYCFNCQQHHSFDRFEQLRNFIKKTYHQDSGYCIPPSFVEQLSSCGNNSMLQNVKHCLWCIDWRVGHEHLVLANEPAVARIPTAMPSIPLVSAPAPAPAQAASDALFFECIPKYGDDSSQSSSSSSASSSSASSEEECDDNDNDNPSGASNIVSAVPMKEVVVLSENKDKDMVIDGGMVVIRNLEVGGKKWTIKIHYWKRVLEEGVAESTRGLQINASTIGKVHTIFTNKSNGPTVELLIETVDRDGTDSFAQRVENGNLLSVKNVNCLTAGLTFREVGLSVHHGVPSARGNRSKAMNTTESSKPKPKRSTEPWIKWRKSQQQDMFQSASRLGGSHGLMNGMRASEVKSLLCDSRGKGCPPRNATAVLVLFKQNKYGNFLKCDAIYIASKSGLFTKQTYGNPTKELCVSSNAVSNLPFARFPSCCRLTIYFFTAG
jgi:hypothetical protein